MIILVVAEPTGVAAGDAHPPGAAARSLKNPK